MTSELPRLLTADALPRGRARRRGLAELPRRGPASSAGDRCEFDWYVWALTDPVTGVGIDPVARIPDMRDAARAIRLKYLTATNRWTTLDVAAALGERAPESPLWRELQEPAGVVDVASVVLREHGNCWGFLDLWSRHPVSPEQVTMLRGVAPGLAEAVRLLRGRTFHGPAQPRATTRPVGVAAGRRADGRRADRRVGAAGCDSCCRRPRIVRRSRRRLQRRRAAARPRGRRRPQRAPRSDAGLGRFMGAGERRACGAGGRDRRHDRADDDAGAPRAVRPRARALEPRTRHRAGAFDRCRDRGDRRAPLPVAVHGAGSPQGRVREDRRAQSQVASRPGDRGSSTSGPVRIG